MAYYNTYMPNQGGGFYGQPMPMQTQMQSMQQMPMQRQEYQNIQSGLQGKSVDNIEVVKAMDIPLNGSISYFPIADGSAIVTKQLMMDGTSKTIIYKPVENETEEVQKYVTFDELDERFKKINNEELKEEIKALKKQLKNISNDIEDMKEGKD